MPRRSARNSGEDIGLSFLAAGVFAIAALANVILATLVALGAYLGLASLVAWYVYVREKVAERQNSEMPLASQFDWKAQKELIQHLVYQELQIRKKIPAVYALGEKDGLRVTEGSGGRRFDLRSGEGKKLNTILDELDSLVTKVDSRAYDLYQSLQDSVPNWRAAHSTVVEGNAKLLAGRTGLIAYAITLVALLIVNPEWLQNISSHAFLAIPAIQSIYGPAALSGAIGWMTALFLRKRFVISLDSSLHAEIIAGWIEVEEAIGIVARLPPDYHPPPGFHDESGPREDGRRSQHEKVPSGDSTSDDQRSWFEILGIPEDSSPDEIKAAWRQSIGKYHPDNVASLGPKLREVAEKESLAINVAYQNAKRMGKA